MVPKLKFVFIDLETVIKKPNLDYEKKDDSNKKVRN